MIRFYFIYFFILALSEIVRLILLQVINNTKQVAGHKDFWETRAKQLLKEMQKNEW